MYRIDVCKQNILKLGFSAEILSGHEGLVREMAQHLSLYHLRKLTLVTLNPSTFYHG